MFEVNDTLDAIFLGAFLFGLLFSALSLVLGAIGIGADHAGHIGHDHDTGSHDYLNISVLLAFVAWFGGVGYLAHNGAGWTAAASVLVAIAGGLVGGYIILQFFRRVIRPAGRAELDPRDYEMQGKLARVTSTIRPGGVGEIVYEQSGARMVRPARSKSETPIARGTEVIVLSADRGVGVVAPWDDFFEEETATVGAEQPAPVDALSVRRTEG